jgi:succinate dehydrogenase / fumarate reductase flavoprotein subunit
MDQYAGLERNETGLNTGLAKVLSLKDKLSSVQVAANKRYCYEVQEAYEVRGMLDLAEIVILSALARRETRGHHYRTDYPQAEAEPKHILVSLQQGEAKIASIPVTKL